MQSGAYQNATWVVGVAKAGNEDGHELMAGSVIVAPSGRVVARAAGAADELVVADCNLDECDFNKAIMFDFARHRRIEHHRPITERAGPIRPR